MTEKRYQLSAIEQGVLNPNYAGYRSCRIEVFDRNSDSPFQDQELHCLIPEELFNAFYEVWDGQEVDVLPKIEWI